MTNFISSMHKEEIPKMAKEKTNFNWRTAPRSIFRVMEWLPYFDRFEHEDYSVKATNRDPFTSKKYPTIYPTRRAIRYAIESDADEPDALTELSFDDFVHGKQPAGDLADKESKVRQIVTTAEQYGFMDADTAKLTPVGHRIVDGSFTTEDFLSQMLKMYVMVDENHGVFPFKTVITLINEFGYISRNEMTFVFGTLDDSDIDNTIQAVREFRTRYDQLDSKNDNKAVEALVGAVWNEHYPYVTDSKIHSMQNDYSDALRRAMEFTEIFYSHGRGTTMKMRVTELNQQKFKMLVERFTFARPPMREIDGHMVQVPSRNSLDWFGAVGNVHLPWDDVDQRRELVQGKLDTAEKLFEDVPEPEFTPERAAELLQTVAFAPIQELKDIESELDTAVLTRNEQLYIQKTSKTKDARKEILERFDTILTDNDMSALWLEVNTWRAFVALSGDNKQVIHNFRMNPDLTPKSFAPGTGNTPDMEVYYNNSLILPEVSLMTGIVQWEHEASSVVDHVYKKIKEHEATDKHVIGLFISSRMNVRTMWQFFLLNRESWIGRPVPVVPLTIEQFSRVMKAAYKTDADIYDVAVVVNSISNVTTSGELTSYEDWSAAIEMLVQTWINERVGA